MSPITYSTTLPASPSPQLQVALNVVESVVNFDQDAFNANATEDFEHVLLPGNAQLPKFSKAVFAERLGIMQQTFAELKMNVKEIIEAPGVLVFYIASYSATKGGNVNDSEVVSILDVAKQSDGTYKATKLREYVDTVRFVAFADAVQKEFAGAVQKEVA